LTPGDAGGIGRIKTEADLERFVRSLIEQQQLNTSQSLPGQLALVDARLKKGGL
jgi:hypothetical protein